MDEPVRHIIRRQTLIVKGVREWEAQDLQREVSNVFREKILPLLDKYLTDYSPNGALHRFDKLEFNLGPVHRDQLEKEMIKQMSVKLKVQFPTSAHISKPVSQKIEPRSKITSHLELFKYFVETGSLPWWSDSSVTDPLNESLAFLVEHKTTAFISLLQSLAGQPAKLERIVRHFTFPKWVDLAALKMNVSSDILHAMILQLMQMLRKIEPWQVISIYRIQELVGIKLLAWVNLSASESQNTPDFWKGFLLQLASSQKLSYADLLSKLYNQIPEKTKTIVKTPNRLLRQIEDLWEAYNEQYKSQNEIREDLILRVREALKMEFLPLQMKVKLEAALNLLSLKKLRLKDLVETDDLLKKLMEIEKLEEKIKAKDLVDTEFLLKELEDLQKQEKVEEVEDLKKLNELKGEKSLEGLEDLSDLIEIEGLSELKSREESTELNESTELEMGNSSVALLERKARLLIHDLTFSTIVKDQLQKVISRIRAGSLDKAEVSKIGTMVGEIEARITICRKLSESLQQLQGIKNLPENLAMQLQKIHEELSGELPQRDRLSNVANLLMRIQRVIRDQKSEEVRSAELLSEDFEKRSHEFSAEEELFVANSGIVIFWPFLTPFFENLGLIENQKFINNSSAHRAVGLLQFLVDGILEPREYNCGLNKVLCGLVWDSVLDFGDPVTDHEKSQCEQFLQSVIANAPVLKDMSIEGFRSSFLMRKGMLKGGPGLWQLFVEKQTYDIVLEKFPWNWKMFKLTWMQWPMEVEWV